MARPRTPIGTFGEIEFRTNLNGSVRARTRFRDDDGQLRPVEVTGPTPKSAERNLKEKLARRGHYAPRGWADFHRTRPSASSSRGPLRDALIAIAAAVSGRYDFGATLVSRGQAKTARGLS